MSLSFAKDSSTGLQTVQNIYFGPHDSTATSAPARVGQIYYKDATSGKVSSYYELKYKLVADATDCKIKFPNGNQVKFSDRFDNVGVTVTTAAGFALPENITVTGASNNYSITAGDTTTDFQIFNFVPFDSETGQYRDITVKIVGSALTYDIDTDISTGGHLTPDPGTIKGGETVTTKLEVDRGYRLPDTITVNGEEGTSGGGAAWEYTQQNSTITIDGLRAGETKVIEIPEGGTLPDYIIVTDDTGTSAGTSGGESDGVHWTYVKTDRTITITNSGDTDEDVTIKFNPYTFDDTITVNGDTGTTGTGTVNWDYDYNTGEIEIKDHTDTDIVIDLHTDEGADLPDTILVDGKRGTSGDLDGGGTWTYDPDAGIIEIKDLPVDQHVDINTNPYIPPSEIIVDDNKGDHGGGTSWTYDPDTGEIVINNPSKDITIEATPIVARILGKPLVTVFGKQINIEDQDQDKQATQYKIYIDGVLYKTINKEG